MSGILNNDDISVCQSVFDEVRERLCLFGKPFDADYYASVVLRLYRLGYKSRDTLLLLAIRTPMSRLRR